MESSVDRPSKQKQLEELEQEMAADVSLPLRDSNLVFGEGNPESAVIFIGEAPGFHEDRLKRPFVGLSGKLLDKLINEIGWKREDIYITNIVKRRPPENRDPLPDEIGAYQPYLERQIAIMKPKVAATLGRFSMNHFLPEAKISRDQGKIFRFKDFLVVPFFHPAAALRSTTMLEALKKSFKELPEIVRGAESLLRELPASDAGGTRVAKAEAPTQKKLF
ncbi:MAG: uracil-DNA glycosylase [Candidatus Liptonbacteria bacterium]|nr:uracil-DNA glycosylase [Parcubacteria group bacterium]MBI4085711.1 uracil-DNA glycosylase [Candidatus Liptonbacteria bacterium]